MNVFLKKHTVMPSLFRSYAALAHSKAVFKLIVIPRLRLSTVEHAFYLVLFVVYVTSMDVTWVLLEGEGGLLRLRLFRCVRVSSFYFPFRKNQT